MKKKQRKPLEKPWPRPLRDDLHPPPRPFRKYIPSGRLPELPSPAESRHAAGIWP